MFILVLPHKENKLHPIYRTIKSQDDFPIKSGLEPTLHRCKRC